MRAIILLGLLAAAAFAVAGVGWAYILGAFR